MKLKVLLFSWLVLFLFTGNTQADSPGLIWLIVDQLSLSELVEYETENIERLRKLGAFGLMNVRTAGHLKPESTYLSAGAGNRCQGSKNSHKGMNLKKGVLNKGIWELIKLNRTGIYKSQPGLLGRTAREHGIVIGVLGNTDTSNGEKRTITAMVMDEMGYIPRGDVSKDLLKRVSLPWGYMTDWEKMKSKYLEYYKDVDALVIETGDMSRIEEYADLLTAVQLKEEKRKALEEIDSFIGYLTAQIDLDDTLLGLVVPTPSSRAQAAGKKLTWVLLAGKNYKQGWLTSLSTRRKGIITISDLLPTFLAGYGVKVGENLPGKPVNYIKADKEGLFFDQIIDMENKIVVNSNLRPYFIKGFILLQLLVVLLVLITLIKKKNSSFFIFQIPVEYLLLSILLVPINYLIISVTGENTVKIVLILLGLTVVEMYILIRYARTRLQRIIVVTVALVITIIYDLSTDFTLLADSLLGYSSIIGARYYGLGNEYMGLFTGSCLIAYTGIAEFTSIKKGRGIRFIIWLLLPFYALMIYYIGASNRGANFGGMVTALFAGAAGYLYYIRDNKPKLKIVILQFFIPFIVIGVLIFLDYKKMLGPRSHIGEALERVIRGEWQSIIQIIYRKVMMNIKLLRWTIWTRVLLAFIAALLFLFKYPVTSLKKLFKDYPYLTAGFYGGLGGSVITMFVNDSGVVAAATILFYPVMVLLYFLLDLPTPRS